MVILRSSSSTSERRCPKVEMLDRHGESFKFRGVSMLIRHWLESYPQQEAGFVYLTSKLFLQMYFKRFFLIKKMKLTKTN